MMKIKIILLFLLVFTRLGQAQAQQADNGDGTFTNPIIWADFPDNDVIRVDDTYYMVCTTMYFFPGVPILKSKDLVNWEYATNVIQRFDQHPYYNLDSGNRYGKGQWASSIRYHKGKFYVLFLTLDEGGFLLTAEKAEGPWKLNKLPKAFYDAGMFFDDDGKNYVVHGFSKLSITEVDENLHPLGKDSLIYDKTLRAGLEGSHVYKINGYYYIYATYGGGDGFQVCLRSKNIYGPYEEKIVLRDDMNLTGMGVHQGALVETQTGEWWSVIFQDRIGVGRVPTLQPVTWTDGWPIVGENGRAVVTYKKPTVGKEWPVTKLPTSDEFSTETLGLQWSWNHNPDDSKWSLAENKGHLRLKTANISSTLPDARNTLSQRIFGPYSIASTRMLTSGMMAGDIAGLGVLQIPHAYIGVEYANGKKSIIMVNNGKVKARMPLRGSQSIYLRTHVNTIRNEAVFYYSNDNITYHPLGDTLHMKFNLKMFTGNRFALFNYATKNTGGYVDFDWFRMQTRQGPPNLMNSTAVDAAMYDEISLARVARSLDTTAANPQDVIFRDNGAGISFNQVSFAKATKKLTIKASVMGKLKLAVYIDNRPAGTFDLNSTPGKAGLTNFTQNIIISKGKHKVLLKMINDAPAMLHLNAIYFK